MSIGWRATSARRSSNRVYQPLQVEPTMALRESLHSIAGSATSNICAIPCAARVLGMRGKRFPAFARWSRRIGQRKVTLGPCRKEIGNAAEQVALLQQATGFVPHYFSDF